jgi:predicted deacylase
MLAEVTARSIRVGGVNVAPGTSRALSIPLSARATDERGAAVAVPAWATVGTKGGPRVTIVAALRGHEATAAIAAAEIARTVEPASITGSLVVVPVLRRGGGFAPEGRSGVGWRYPGDAGGTRSARDAFVLFSEIVVGSAVVLVLGSPPPGRRGVLCVRGDLDDPRMRRLALETGAVAALPARAAAGSLMAAAAAAGVTALELRAGDGGRAVGGAAARPVEVDQLVAAVRGVLVSVGLVVVPPAAKPAVVAARAAGDGKGDAKGDGKGARGASTAPLVVGRPLVVRAPIAGLIEPALSAGQLVRKGAAMARIVPPLGGKAAVVAAPRDGVVLESPLRAAEPRGAKLFVVGPLPRAVAVRARRAAAAAASADGAGVAVGATATSTSGRPADAPAKLRVGWVEHVALPNLGITRLKAKIDTGARTSALHVSRMKVVDTEAGPQHRPILEITVPGGPRGTRPIKIRASARGHVVVRDTSGRMEKRPVIETALQIGPWRRRILVTLTNRGDMLFPMLIGRTALGPGIIVDPSRRYLLSIN